MKNLETPLNLDDIDNTNRNSTYFKGQIQFFDDIDEYFKKSLRRMKFTAEISKKEEELLENKNKSLKSFLQF